MGLFTDSIEALEALEKGADDSPEVLQTVGDRHYRIVRTPKGGDDYYAIDQDVVIKRDDSGEVCDARRIDVKTGEFSEAPPVAVRMVSPKGSDQKNQAPALSFEVEARNFKETINKLDKNNQFVEKGPYVIARFSKKPNHTYEFYHLKNKDEIKNLKINKNAIIVVGEIAYVVENKRKVLNLETDTKAVPIANLSLSNIEKLDLNKTFGKVKRDSDIDPSIAQSINNIIEKAKTAVISDESTAYDYYAFDKRILLGKGAFGSVYPGYSVDPRTGECLKKKKTDLQTGELLEVEERPMVGKFIDVGKVSLEANREESRHIHGYFLSNDVIQAGEQMLQPMERLPGKSLDKFIENGEMDALSDSQRVDLLLQCMFNLNLIHHETDYTGDALIHADIKPANIQISIDANKTVNAYLLDFGLAKTVKYSEGEAAKEESFGFGGGTPLYMAPETYINRQIKTKSDIYSFALVMISVLGGDKLGVDKLTSLYDKKLSYRNEANYEKAIKDNIKNIFAEEGFFKNSNFPEDVKRSTEWFISRALSVNDEKRPDADECLSFLNTLRNFARTHELSISDPVMRKDLKDSLNANRAKLAILASPSMTWEQKVQLVEEKVKNPPLTDPSGDVLAKQVAQFDRGFDLAACPEACEAIFNDKGSLNIHNIVELVGNAQLKNDFPADVKESTKSFIKRTQLSAGKPSEDECLRFLATLSAFAEGYRLDKLSTASTDPAIREDAKNSLLANRAKLAVLASPSLDWKFKIESVRGNLSKPWAGRWDFELEKNPEVSEAIIKGRNQLNASNIIQLLVVPAEEKRQTAIQSLPLTVQNLFTDPKQQPAEYLESLKIKAIKSSNTEELEKLTADTLKHREQIIKLFGAQSYQQVSNNTKNTNC